MNDRTRRSTVILAVTLFAGAAMASAILARANADRPGSSGAARARVNDGFEVPTTVEEAATTSVPTTVPSTSTTVPGTLTPADLDTVIATLRSRVTGRVRRPFSTNSQVLCEGPDYPANVHPGSQLACTLKADTGEVATTTVDILDVRSFNYTITSYRRG